MAGRYKNTQNTIDCALFSKVGRMETKYRGFPKRGDCFKFIIEIGNIKISSDEALYMFSKRYYSPTSCHRHGRNEVKQDRPVT